MGIQDKFQQLSTTILNAIKTRANRDLSNLSAIGNTKLEAVLSASGGGLEIGDIGIAPMGVDESRNKRRYLNGQVISQEQFAVFTIKLKTAIGKYPTLACSEADWQNIALSSEVGQCGKFVIDDEAKTIRLPKLVNPVKGLYDLTSLANIQVSGLPNVVASGFMGENSAGFATHGTGALYYSDPRGLGSNGGADNDNYVGYFDASRCSAVYGRSHTVQPESIQYPYFIQVSTGNELEGDITTQVQVNTPYSLFDYKYSDHTVENASWVLSNGQWCSGATYTSAYNKLVDIKSGTIPSGGISVKLHTETYSDTDFVINKTENTFRLPYTAGYKFIVDSWQSGTSYYRIYNDGWIEQGGRSIATATSSGNLDSVLVTYHKPMIDTNYNLLIATSDIENGYPNVSNGHANEHSWGALTTTSFKWGLDGAYASRQQACNWVVTGYVNSTYTTPKLYFYLGETTQDANLISVGSVFNTIADLKGKTLVETYSSGTSGYRLYADGWCIQWGELGWTSSSWAVSTRTLLKPYLNTSYLVLPLGNWSGSESSSCTVQAKTTTSFEVRYAINSTAQLGAWVTLGYASRPVYSSGTNEGVQDDLGDLFG